MITITKLKYALAVQKHEHFGKAAESLFVTQPTLSIGISSIEREIGYKLFDRLPGGSVRYNGVTEQGQHFLQRAAKLVADFDDLVKG